MYKHNLLRRQVYNEKKKRSMVLLTFLLIFSLYLLWTLVFDENGVIRYYELKAQRDRLVAEIGTIQKENASIREEIKLMQKDPFYLEKKAREELNLSRPDEYIFVFEK